MDLSPPTKAVGRTFRSRPTDLLPFYVLQFSVATISQTVSVIGVAVAYAYLEATGRLEAVRAELAAVDTEMPEPDADPAAVEEWIEGVLTAIEPAVTPGVLAILALTILAAVLVSFVLYAVVSAGAIAACYGLLRGERGTVAGIAGVRRHWLTFLALSVLEVVLWAASAAVAAAVALGVGLLFGVADGGLGALFAVLVGGLALLVLLAVVRATFAIAPVAVVVDDVGAIDAVRRTLGFARREPAAAALYLAIAVGAIGGLVALTWALVFVEAPAVGGVLGALVVYPALDLLKTALFGSYRGSIAPPSPPAEPARVRVVGGIRRGLRELGAFVREAPGSHALAVAALLGGFAVGWIVADPYVGIFEASIAGRLEGHLPPAAALNFFANNWGVALGTAFAGVALAIPAITALAFNGVFFGVYARLEAEPAELAAFVAPHGVLEIPAIAVAGALGIHLGVAWWRTLRGRSDREALADALERALWVLVGVGALLAVAAVIEGFVSPYYYELFL